MSDTLTIQSTGTILLPVAFMEKFALKPGAILLADLTDEGMALKPENSEVSPLASDSLKTVSKDGFTFLTGTETFDAVDAISAEREKRSEQLFDYRHERF